MDKRRLGSTDLHLSVVGFGSGPFAGGYGDISVDTARDAVKKALEQGINFVDTAPFYSSKSARSEELMGHALKGIPRDSFIINTKTGRDRVNGEAVYNYSAYGVRKSFERSLQRLQLEYVDMLTLHDVEFANSVDQVVSEALPEMRKIQKEGKAKYIGISGYPLDVLLIIARKFPLDFVLTYAQYCIQNERLSYYIEEFRKVGCGVLNAAPLVLGFFTPQGPPVNHQASKDFTALSAPIAKLCADNGIDVALLANKYALQAPLSRDRKITSTLIGVSSADQIMTALKSLEPLTPKEEQIIAEIKKTLGTRWLNYCWREPNSNELQFIAAEKSYVSPYTSKAKL
jgi:aryl-alcohol dehydrogenase-like predicted oxidoreductase